MPAGGRRVTVFAKSTAVSVSPVRPGKTYPLSALDELMGRHTLHLVFYYRPGPTLDREGLKESLSEVLSHYPAVTGRLGRGEDGGWTVKCNDAGVRLLDARASVTLEEWLGSATAEEEMELACWEPMGEDPSIWSPYYIQITEFEDKAFAIGLSCTHMHADPTCAILLVRAWADSHRRASIAYAPFFHPPAFLPRPDPRPDHPLLSLKSSSSALAAAPKMSSATFRFSDLAVKSLLADLQADASPFSALAALFWSRIARASGVPPGPGELTLFVDFRKRMHAPLPHGFYGNALHFSRARADLADGVAHVADHLGRHVAGLQEEEFWAAAEWAYERRRRGEEAFQMYGPELTCLALDHVTAYGAAFEKEGEGGRPAHVSCRVGGADGEGVVVVLPAAEEGAARTVVVTLPEEVAKTICRDDAILRYGPTVMFAGRG
ncbi:protein ECERIFERUM 26-like [Phoenix dactylifera]|uniref:Protein ECERIFERUM 26-like n=1 Tax=Phoenix dactylifera TaxID=42345 RepID=A0A8B7D229_PHODC|nr:protein ECERIFERUM 26-like [Phoenix dactylifera]